MLIYICTHTDTQRERERERERERGRGRSHVFPKGNIYGSNRDVNDNYYLLPSMERPQRKRATV